MSSEGSVIDVEEDFGTWFRSSLAPYVVHAGASLSCVLIFVWTLHFRGHLGWSGTEVFNFHPLLQSVAFVLLIPESILLLRFSGFKRSVSKPFHAALHTLALIVAILGSAAAFKYKKDQGGSHFRSLHSWLGLATVGILVVQWIFGSFLFYRATGSTRVKCAPVHIHTGHMIVFTSALTIVTGVTERLVFVGACTSSLSHECLTANFAALSVVVTFTALGIALTAVKRGASMRPLNESLLSVEVTSDAIVA